MFNLPDDTESIAVALWRQGKDRFVLFPTSSVFIDAEIMLLGRNLINAMDAAVSQIEHDKRCREDPEYAYWTTAPMCW